MGPKKKKEKDFKKKKLNVGGAKDQGNLTNLSFKSKSIVVRTQSVADSDAVSDAALKGNLDLKYILSMLLHHSGSNRKDSMNKLKDLISDDQRTMVLHLSQIINATAPILLDREFEVRKALIQFAKVLVKLAPAKLLLPFVSVIITYACSAMNHIVNEIRYDAVRFINVWIDVFPATFIPASPQIIQNYMSLLSLKRQKVSGQDSFVKKSKESIMDGDQIVVLASMNQLLKLSTETCWQSTFIPAEYSLYFKKDITLTRSADRWHQNTKWNLDIFSNSLASISSNPIKSANDRIELSLGETTVSKKPIQADTWGPSEFINAIVPVCIDIWLEAAAIVLSGAMINETQGLEKLNLSMSILHQSLVKNFNGPSNLDLGGRKAIVASFAKHVLVSFPYGHNAVGIKTEHCEQVLQEMNIKTCEIVSLFQPQDWAAGQSDSKVWEETMFAYIFKIIAAKDDILPLQSMKMIFPLCESTLKNGSKRGIKLMELLVRRHKELSAKTALWMEMFQFIQDAFMNLSPNVNRAAKSDWLGYLPKALWSLGASNPKGSQHILAFLSMILRQSVLSDDVEVTKMVNSVKNGLVPFFHVVTPQKGPLFGPFLLLPLDCQKAAIELLYYLPTWSEILISGLAACLTCPLADVAIVSRALEISFERQNFPEAALEWPLFFGFVLSVGVTGTTASVAAKISGESSAICSYEDYCQMFGVHVVGTGGLQIKWTEIQKDNAGVMVMARKRIYLSKMIACLLLSNSVLIQNGLIDFTMDMLTEFVPSLKSLDAFFGVSTLLSNLLEEAGDLVGHGNQEHEFLVVFGELCTSSIRICVNTSHENYELFKTCAEASHNVLKWFPALASGFKEELARESKSMSFSNRDRVKMILDRL
ncbi:hypothetical protein BDR26DRAFT_856403 [Obelidium mucronatum]|nr:hypothetical protein BDR26DRAFT_856403 [Obelidium mucronatum]